MQTISKTYTPIENNNKVNNLKSHLYYDKGGMNYFTGNVEKRGIYLAIPPVHRTSKEGFVTETTTAFTGTKVLLEEKSRFSKKVLDFKPTEEQIKALTQYVLKANNLNINSK